MRIPKEGEIWIHDGRRWEVRVSRDPDEDFYLISLAGWGESGSTQSVSFVLEDRGNHSKTWRTPNAYWVNSWPQQYMLWEFDHAGRVDPGFECPECGQWKNVPEDETQYLCDECTRP